MKPIRLFAAFFFVWMTLTAAVAAADITVTKRDVNMAAGLDKNVANILVLLQDGETTDTMMVASINSRTGRSVMMRVDCRPMFTRWARRNAGACWPNARSTRCWG